MSAPDSRPTLGLWMTTALVIGNTVGSGVFLLPSSLAPYGGISILGWIFASAGALMVAFLLAHMGRRMPSAGGGCLASCSSNARIDDS